MHVWGQRGEKIESIDRSDRMKKQSIKSIEGRRDNAPEEQHHPKKLQRRGEIAPLFQISGPSY